MQLTKSDGLGKEQLDARTVFDLKEQVRRLKTELEEMAIRME